MTQTKVFVPKGFELDFISLLSLSSLSLVFDVTHTESLSLSLRALLSSSSSRNDSTTALRTRRVGESGVRRDAEMVWTGTCELFCVFCFWIEILMMRCHLESRKSGSSSSTIREYIYTNSTFLDQDFDNNVIESRKSGSSSSSTIREYIYIYEFDDG